VFDSNLKLLMYCVKNCNFSVFYCTPYRGRLKVICEIHPINLSVHRVVIASKATWKHYDTVFRCDLGLHFHSLLLIMYLKVLAIIYGDAAKEINNIVSRVHVSACFMYSTVHTKFTVTCQQPLKERLTAVVAKW